MLRADLQRWRGVKAKEIGKPAYVVFDNKTLDLIVEAKPRNLAALGRVKGVGLKKLDDYGAEVLAIIGGDSAGASASAGGAKNPFTLAAERRSNEVGTSSFGAANLGTPQQREQLSAPDVASIFKTKAATPGTAPTPSGPSAGLTLSEARTNFEERMNAEQKAVVSAILDGRNVFFHGAAGTGKSFVLQTAVALLRGDPSRGAVAITAPTGIAAVGVGGVTVHKFIGAGLCAGHPAKVAQHVARSKAATARWMETSTLIIDEVSMLDADLLAKLDWVGRSARNEPNTPFGGLQLVCTGDFYQLPPVSRGGGEPPFAFDCDAWRAADFAVVELVKVLRQRDQRLVDALNEVRVARVSSATCALFRSLSRPLPPNAEGVLPTRLYSVNANVDAENAGELAKLPGESVTFEAHERGDDAGALDALRKNCPVPASLTLKVGAQVVLLRNVDDDLVNGSRGVVKAFVSKNETEFARHRSSFRIHPSLATIADSMFPRVPLVAFDNGRVLAVGPAEFSAHGGGKKYAERLQTPLKLAWALTVHKSQGMTISQLETNLRDAFDYGQVYVALSRAVSIEGLRVMGFDPEKVRVHPKVQHFYARQGGKGGKETLQGLWEDRENTTRQNLHQPGARGEDGGYREPSRVSQPPPTFASSQRPGVPSTSSCYRCGETGHWARDCPKTGGGRGIVSTSVAPTHRGGASYGGSEIGGYTTCDPPSP